MQHYSTERKSHHSSLYATGHTHRLYMYNNWPHTLYVYVYTTTGHTSEEVCGEDQEGRTHKGLSVTGLPCAMAHPDLAADSGLISQTSSAAVSFGGLVLATVPRQLK